MEMIDILNKLREFEQAGHSVGDAINNVERTNPVTEADDKQLAQELAKYFQDVADSYPKRQHGDQEHEEMTSIADAFRTDGLQAGMDDINTSRFEFSSNPFNQDGSGDIDDNMMMLLKKHGVTAKLKGDLAYLIKGGKAITNPVADPYESEQPVTDEGAMKEIDTVKKEKARLHARLKDLKSKYNAQMAGAYAGNPDDTEAEIEKIEKELGISQEAKDMKKESVNESITIATDSPQEASMMMQILKLAGVQPVDQAMINQPSEQEGCGCDDSCSCGGDCGDDCDCEGCAKKDETYANEPDTKTQSVDDLVNVHSGGLNRQKQQFAKAQDGDNAMAVETLANSLREQYKAFKEAYQQEAKNAYAVGMAQAMKSTGDKPPLEKSTIKKAHDIAKSIEKSEK
jgi:hypothetical protein